MDILEWYDILFAFILLLLIPCIPTLLSATVFYAIDGGFNKKPNQVFWNWTSFSDYFETHYWFWMFILVFIGPIILNEFVL